jgi:hypothetical protein
MSGNDRSRPNWSSENSLVATHPTIPDRHANGTNRSGPDHNPEYDDLLAKAAAVHWLPFTESTSDSRMAASQLMVDEADELYAVWDGKPAGLRRGPPTSWPTPASAASRCA